MKYHKITMMWLNVLGFEFGDKGIHNYMEELQETNDYLKRQDELLNLYRKYFNCKSVMEASEIAKEIKELENEN